MSEPKLPADWPIRMLVIVEEISRLLKDIAAGDARDHGFTHKQLSTAIQLIEGVGRDVDEVAGQVQLGKLLEDVPENIAEVFATRMTPEKLAELLPRPVLDQARQIAYERERAAAGGEPLPLPPPPSAPAVARNDESTDQFEVTRTGLQLRWGLVLKIVGWIVSAVATAAGLHFIIPHGHE